VIPVIVRLLEVCQCGLLFLNSADIMKYPSFNASLGFRKRKKIHSVLDLGNWNVAEQSYYYWPEISAQTKPSDQEHSYGGETSIQCTISQVIFTAHLLVDVVEHLPRNVRSQFVPVGQIHNAEIHVCQTKWSACTAHCNKLSCFRSEIRDCSTETTAALLLSHLKGFCSSYA
jgi:hypothetical protein